MTTSMRPSAVPRPTDGRPEPAGIRWDRAVVGLLIIALGAGWLLDAIGVSVPWRLFPAAGLVVVGGAVLVARRHRGRLIGLGVVLVLAAVLSAVTAARFVGPVGQRTIVPEVADWPVDSSLSVGDLTVDLTGPVLPLDEEIRVGVGVGEIRLIVPAGAQVRVDVGVGLGDIRVDGVSVDDGFGPQWTEQAATTGAVLLDAQVGLGSIEVRHE